MSIEQLITSFSYVAIFILMSANGISSFPSSQLIYIISGYFAFTGNLNFLLVILIGSLGQSLGNYILYEISRRKGLKYSVKFIKIFFPLINPEKHIKKFQITFKKRSKFLLFIGKLVNPIKIFIPIPAGIVKMNRAVFLIIVYITSAIWALIFTSIGYYFGKSYKHFGYFGAIILLIAIVVMAYFYKLMNSEEIIKELEKER